MDRVQVASSSLESIGYDAGSETLEVEFKRGDVYEYYNVPQSMHEQLMLASSIGEFFNANIRNAFACSRV